MQSGADWVGNQSWVATSLGPPPAATTNTFINTSAPSPAPPSGMSSPPRGILPPGPSASSAPDATSKPALVLLASSPSPTPSLSPLPSPSAARAPPSRPDTPTSPAFPHEEVPDPRPSALLAPVRGLRALARVCAGGGAVAYAAARRRRRLDGDPDVDGELGGSRGRDTPGWRSARPAEEGHRVQVLVGGRVSPALSYGSRPSGEWGRPSFEGRSDAEWMERSPLPSPSLRAGGEGGESVEGYTVDGSEASASASASVMSSPAVAMSPEQAGHGGFRWPWSSAGGVEEQGEGERPAPFAAEVAIKGWQVVGGKSWDDSAKVGAYVGESGALG